MRRLRTASVRGFTLTELAVVVAIVGLLLGSLMFTLTAQVEQRALEETDRRLKEARELLLGFTVVNGRLPCPATVDNGGTEAIATAATSGTGGTCSAYYNGYLPAAALGFSPQSAQGMALDAWGNRIRYAISSLTVGGQAHFTNNVTLRANWNTATFTDIDICKTLAAEDQSSCASASDRVVTQGTAVAVIWSQGKNFASSGAASTDEKNNNDAFSAFVSRALSPYDSPQGEFDDLLVWIPVGALYGRLISAGVLP
jgi:prepilin-type N-terminal cleavage/methylation domain-containing protein